MTIGAMGDRVGAPDWQIPQVITAGLLAEPLRFRPFRIVTAADVPAVKAPLGRAGYLPPVEAADPAGGAA
jgi:hypothetical protein